MTRAGQRGRCDGNDTTCWNVGRFCQGMLGWPTIPSDWKPMASYCGIARSRIRRWP